MASANSEKLPAVKQEDCEWGTSENTCVKLEDCEEQISVFKEEEECKEELLAVKVEDLEDFSVRPEPQNLETGNVFKQEISEDSHSSLQHRVTGTGQLGTQQGSLEVKSEFLESEEKIKDGNGREAEEQPSSKSTGINFQKNGSFSPSSFARPSLQCRLQQKQDKKKMKKSTRGSEDLTSASLFCSSLPSDKPTQSEANNTEEQQVRDALSTSPECGKTFKKKSDCKDKSIPPTQTSYACLECGKQFQHRNSLYRHKRVHNDGKPTCCLECGKQFPNNSALLRHTRLHTGEKPYICAQCGKGFSFLSKLHIHMRVHSGEKPYRCSECGKGFTQKSGLRSHIRSHTGEKPHCCLECGKRFCDGSALQRHKRIHTGEKPYVCSECGKRFTDSSNLQKHTSIHTTVKPYCCSECGKKFIDSSDLQNHARVHNKEKKTYRCLNCGKQCANPSSLQRHMRVHTGERPYLCSKCGKAFRDISARRQHTQIHTGEKPYCCSECGKRFSASSSLRQHARSHTGEKPFCCPECGKRFSHRRSLNYHLDIHTREKRIKSKLAMKKQKLILCRGTEVNKPDEKQLPGFLVSLPITITLCKLQEDASLGTIQVLQQGFAANVQK
ncbi:ZN850 protein, partial [Polypterus senegalus]|nr:ZN850 protein [Polypterus senegalus]